MLSTPDVFADYQRSQELCDELENAKVEHEACLENWLVMSEEADG